MKSAPNVSPSDCSLLAYLTMGYQLGKCSYFGLTFPLEDSTNLNELKALNNGYVEVKDGVVKMGVLKLENLERILRAPYIKLGSVQISWKRSLKDSVKLLRAFRSLCANLRRKKLYKSASGWVKLGKRAWLFLN